MIDPADLITLEEGGELVGRAPVTLRQAVLRGRLEAWKVGKTWVTTPDRIAEYVATSRERRRPGRRAR
jgi:hypothetical protein